MIPMHAVATGEPQRVRWVVAPDQLPAPGRVRYAPGRLGELQESGVVEELTVDGAGIAVTLSPQQSWRARGEEIRVALDEALREPSAWRLDPSGRAAAIARAAEELLGGVIGELAGSHGGAIELIGVTGAHVRVRMSGSCRGCPASGSTLHERLQRDLRRRFGDDVTVSEEHSSAAASMGRKLLTLFVR